MKQLRILKLYLDRVDCAIQVSPGDGCDNQEADGCDKQEAALDKKGEIEYHEVIANTEALPRQRGLCDPSKSRRRSQKRDGYKHRYEVIIGKQNKGKRGLHRQDSNLIKNVRKNRM
jgi:hypothetical protein